MPHNTKYYRKKLKKTESSKKNRCAFSSASISIGEFCKYHPQTDRKSRSIGRNCRIVCFHKKLSSTSAGVPSQCDDTHSNHDSSDDNQSSDGSQSTQDTCLVPDQRLFMSTKYELEKTGCTTVQQRGLLL